MDSSIGRSSIGIFAGGVKISASSQLGISGSVLVPDFTFLQHNLSSLATDLVNPDRVIADRCVTQRQREQGSFTVTGTGGLPRNPDARIGGRYAAIGVESVSGGGTGVSPVEAVEEKKWKLSDSIQEARGMIVTADGRTLVGTTQSVAMVKARDLVCHPSTD